MTQGRLNLDSWPLNAWIAVGLLLPGIVVDLAWSLMCLAVPLAKHMAVCPFAAVTMWTMLTIPLAAAFRLL